MPIYQYRCRNCGRIFDELRSIDDRDDETMCSTCASTDVARSLDVSFSHSPGAKAKPLIETSDAHSESPVNATLENITVENCGTGMKFDGVKIRGRDWTFKGNQTAIEHNNSDIEVGGDITIE